MALPPTATKFSSDANNVTTFFFDFPNFTGSHSGVTATLGVNSVAGGGTGLATLTANSVIIGNGTSSPTFVTAGTPGNVLTDNGTTWVSSPPSGGGNGAWIPYTPTTQGIGTLAVADFWYKYDGNDSIYVKGTFLVATTSAVQAQISLPAGYTVEPTKVNATKELVGMFTSSNSNTAVYTALISPSNTYLTFGFSTNTGGGLNQDTGSNVFAPGSYSFSTTAIPISP